MKSRYKTFIVIFEIFVYNFDLYHHIKAANFAWNGSGMESPQYIYIYI